MYGPFADSAPQSYLGLPYGYCGLPDANKIQQIDATGEQRTGGRAYRIARDGHFRTLWQRDHDGRWNKQYRFTLQPRQFSDFEEMCHYHQSAAESPFTRNRICTRATPQGRISLYNSRLVITGDGKRTERPIGSQQEYHLLLSEHFGIDLSEQHWAAIRDYDGAPNDRSLIRHCTDRPFGLVSNDYG